MILFFHLWIEGLETRSQNDRPNIDLPLLRCLFQVYGVVLTYPFANTALILFQIKAAFINIRDQGNGLSEVYMDGFVLRYLLIVLIRVFDREIFYTGGTTRAFVLQNIPGLLDQLYLEVSYVPFYTVNFSVGEDLYVGMPADLDQFRREYSHGAVIGGKGLVQLGHVAPNTRGLFNQVNLETGRRKVKGGLNAADPSPHNHDVSKRAVL